MPEQIKKKSVRLICAKAFWPKLLNHGESCAPIIMLPYLGNHKNLLRTIFLSFYGALFLLNKFNILFANIL